MSWTLIVQLITLIAFLVVLYWLAARPVGKILNQRTDRIETGLRQASESQRRAQEIQQETQRQLDEAKVESQGIIAQANRAAELQRQTLLEQAQRDADALLARARDAIGRERQAAVDELRREAGRAAVYAATRVVEDSLKSNPDAGRQLADETITDVGRGQ